MQKCKTGKSDLRSNNSIELEVPKTNLKLWNDVNHEINTLISLIP